MEIPRNDLWAVEFMVAALMASKLDATWEPLFAVIGGPASVGKTEMIRPTLDWPGMTQVVTATTRRGMDSATVKRPLVTELDRRTLVCTDLSEILRSSLDDRNAFFAPLRTLYDGFYEKRRGTSDQAISVRGRCSAILCATDEIYPFAESDATFGTRFLIVQCRHNLTRAEEDRINRRITERMPPNSPLRSQLLLRVRNALDILRIRYRHPNAPLPTQYPFEPEYSFEKRVECAEREQKAGWWGVEWPHIHVPEAWNNWGNIAARLLCFLRIGARADMDHTITRERSHRIYKTLTTAVSMRAIADNRNYIDESDVEFARSICRDTPSAERLTMLGALTDTTEDSKKNLLDMEEECLASVGYIDATVRQWLRNEFLLGTRHGFWIEPEAKSEWDFCDFLDLKKQGESSNE
jgi:hypothetical protein